MIYLAYMNLRRYKKSVMWASYSIQIHEGKYSVQGFPQAIYTWGDLSPPSAGGQTINGGTHERGHRSYGGDPILIDYIIN